VVIDVSRDLATVEDTPAGTDDESASVFPVQPAATGRTRRNTTARHTNISQEEARVQNNKQHPQRGRGKRLNTPIPTTDPTD